MWIALLFLVNACFADTPPPQTISSKTLDGSGNPITSTIVSSKRALDVNLTGGSVVIGGTVAVSNFPAVQPVSQNGTWIVQEKSPINVTASGSTGTVSTVTTLTAPANTVGFVLMNLDTSTANIRWAIGRTAGTTTGQQLQPGRDTGFVPCGLSVSLISESGTQNYDIQWVSQ